MQDCNMTHKILILTNSIFSLYCSRREVVKAIIDAGYDLYISVPHEDDDVTYFNEIGCHIIHISLNRRGMNPFSDFRLMLKYYSVVKRLKPIVVLTYTIKPNLYGGMVCRFLRVPQIANITGLGDAVENGGWLRKLIIFLYKISLSKVYKVFFQNNANRDFFLSMGMVEKRTYMLPGSGVNLHYHSYQDYPREDGIIRFLFIGRLLKDKGVEEYFQMARNITQRYSNVDFRLLGEVTDYFKSQLDSLKKDGIITYLGTTRDVRPYIRDVECTVMPSYHEGMSNVNLESAANGRPVITTNVSGCKETVEDYRTGYLVEAKNTQQLIDAVERFINLPYKQKVLMGKEAREKVVREFDRQIIIDAYLSAIKTLTTLS